MQPPKRILQLTDLHLFKNKTATMLNFNPYDSLQQVMHLVNKSIQEQTPSLIALTGDISQDYSQESYEITRQIFKDMPYPLVATMGNHDKLPVFAEFFTNPEDSVNKVFYLDNWMILFINSYWSGHIGGKLTENELTFLHNALASKGDKSTIIFMHHHVLSVKSAWIDKIGVSNAVDFLDVIDKHQNIKAVICGHVHQDTLTERNDVKYFSTPSTSWQFLTNSPSFKLDSLMPGFRFLDLYEDGTFNTGVVRISHNQVFIPNLNSPGY